MTLKKRVGYACRIAIVLILLLGSIAALIAVAVIQDNWKYNEYNMEYGIVIDSGSSRSNIYLYEWPGEKENETGVVVEKLNCKVNGVAISEMKVDESKDKETWQGFQSCMDEIKKVVPVEKHSSTTLFLGATAGMRLLHAKDEQRSNNVLESLRKYLSSLPFKFQHASIITGQEEGLYGWITVNYLMGNFLEKNAWNAYIRPDGAKTVGSMDLGGASTQIAFAIQEQLNGSDYMQVKLYGYPYNVYTHSFLCYGKNEADKRLLDKVIQESSDKSSMINPCYPDGYNVSVKASTIYDTECTKKPKNYNPDHNYQMVGSGNSKDCGRLVKSLFDFKTCSSTQCSFDGVEQPPVTGNFMAYAGFYFITRALLLDDDTDLNKYNTSIKNFCQTSWLELKATRHEVAERFLRTYCFGSHYVFTLLADGYKFDQATWKGIHFAKQVSNTSIGWSLGFMLSRSNMIPSEVKEILPLTKPAFAGLIFLFSALLIIAMVIVFIFLVRTCY